MVQDKGGAWYHVNFGPSGNGTKADFIVKKVDLVNGNIRISDGKIYSTKDSYSKSEQKSNSEAHKRYVLDRYLDASNDTQIYIKGDFSASLAKANEYKAAPPLLT